MLRIGTPPPSGPDPSQGGPDPQALLAALSQGGADPSQDPSQADPSDSPQKAPGDMVDPKVAGYLGPEFGPFKCSNCEHFDPQGLCSIVAGPIDPEGCCNLFNSSSESSDDDNDASSEPDQDADDSQVAPNDGSNPSQQ